MRYVVKAILNTLVLFSWCYVGWSTLWSCKLILSPPHQGWWNWALVVLGISWAAKDLTQDLAAQNKTPGWWWSAPRRVSETLSLTLSYFIFLYIGWGVLWATGRVSTPPISGWWDWMLPWVAICSGLEDVSADLEVVEKTRGFWGPYPRQAALGVIYGLGVLAIGIKTGLPWLEDLPSNVLLATTFALSGAGVQVIRTAGRRRDRPALAAMEDFAAGAVGGATIVWAFGYLLWAGPDAQSTLYVSLGLGAVLGGGLNLWRRSARGGNPIFVSALRWSRPSADTQGRAGTARADDLAQAGVMPRTPEAFNDGLESNPRRERQNPSNAVSCGTEQGDDLLPEFLRRSTYGRHRRDG